jgi:hypothetical protein
LACIAFDGIEVSRKIPSYKLVKRKVLTITQSEPEEIENGASTIGGTIKN